MDPSRHPSGRGTPVLAPVLHPSAHQLFKREPTVPAGENGSAVTGVPTWAENLLIMKRRSAVLIIAVLALAAAFPSPPASATRKGAPYSVPVKVLDAALDCRPADGAAQGEPVLLVHGTGVNRELNWEWNYWRTLPAKGFTTCWVQIPKAELYDIQISAEYVARAIDVMRKRFMSEVDILGHSQGGLIPRWSIKWFASGRFVDDYIGLASPNHGTTVAGTDGMCFESCWQMRTNSNFIAALNRDDETPGDTDYTSIYTATDELVQPVGTQALDGGVNILLQDLCPARPVDHLGIAGDAVTFDLVLHMLRSSDQKIPGPVDCTQTIMDGASYPPPEAFPPDYSDGSLTSEEPPLKSYAR